MSKNKRKGPSSGAVFMLLMVAALGLGGLGAYVTGYGPASKVPADQHRNANSEPVVLDRQGQRETDLDQASRAGKPEKVWVPSLRGEKIRLVQTELRNGDPKLYVVNRTLEALDIEGARAEHVTVAGGVAKIDFNQKVLDGMGSLEESTFIEALQKAMGQFREVDMLRFTVEGKEIESLGGHIEVIDGVEVIRPAKRDETP